MDYLKTLSTEETRKASPSDNLSDIDEKFERA